MEKTKAVENVPPHTTDSSKPKPQTKEDTALPTKINCEELLVLIASHFTGVSMSENLPLGARLTQEICCVDADGRHKGLTMSRKEKLAVVGDFDGGMI